MLLSHIKQQFGLKTEDGEYFLDLFNSVKDGLKPETRDRKLENKKDIVFRLTESIYFDLDPSFEEKPMEKSQLGFEKPKSGSHAQSMQMLMNFVETFKSREQIYWALEILGNVFLFVGSEERIYEKGLEIYRVLLMLLPKIGVKENQSFLKLENAVLPVKLLLEEEDKQKLFRLVASHLSLAFEKVEAVKRAEFLLKVVDVFNRHIILNPLIIRDDTWEFILFVLIGVMDHVVQKSKKMDSKVAEELENQLIMSLMNAWISSGMRDYTLWKKFSAYARNWQNVELFLGKWKEVCLGLTRKMLRDTYSLPFTKVKLDGKESPLKDASSRQDYAVRASTFLLIAYDKPKNERIEPQNSYNVNIFPKSQVFIEMPENNQQLFWANVSSEQTVFLWHKFLHLFERHPCESQGPNQPQQSLRFWSILLRTIQEIVNEILKIGHGVSAKKLRIDPSKDPKEHFLTIKAIESIWAKAIQPRRIEKTQCVECAKKSGRILTPGQQPEDPLQRPARDREKAKEHEDMMPMQRSSEVVIKDEHSMSKKEVFERDMLKNISKQKSLRPASKKSIGKDPILKHRVQENNKYKFCRHRIAKGDDLLAVFAKWLYECGSPSISGFEELNLLSIQILAKIFRKTRGPFKEEYLLKFYCLLLENIKKEEPSGYLKICVKLFEGNLPNIYCLIKEFVFQFANISFKSQPTKFLDIYSKYISRFVCSYLGRLKYIEEFEVKFEKFRFSLDFWINHVLECLKLWEKKEKNTCLKIVNWVLSIHNVNNQQFNTVIRKIFTSCKENFKQNRLNSLQLMHLSFSIMLTLGEIYHLKRLRVEDGLNKHELGDIKNSLDFLFDEIDSFIKRFEIKTRLARTEGSTIRLDQQREAEKDKEKENDVVVNISLLILQCIYIWLTLPFSDITENIYNFAVSLFVDVFQNTCFKRINDYSSLILKNLMNNMGKSLSFQNTILLSTAISSIEDTNPDSQTLRSSIFESSKLSQSVMINQDVIVTFYLGELSPNEDLVLCIRNPQGRFIWQGELIYKLFPNRDYEPFTDFETLPYKTNAEIYENLRFFWQGSESQEKGNSTPSEKNNEAHEEQTSHEEEEETSPIDIERMIEREFEAEEQFEAILTKQEEKTKDNYHFESNQSRYLKHQLEVNSLPETRLMNITKLFLFHFGMLDLRNSVENPNKTIFLENSKELWDSLRELDRMSERSQIEVNCFYVEQLSQTEMRNIVSDEKLYREYTEFIDSISCTLDETSLKTGMYESMRHLLKKHPSFNYSSNMLFEIAYIQPQLYEKTPKNPTISVLWNARAGDDRFDNRIPAFLKNFMDEIPKHFIMITPLTSSLFSIKVFKMTEMHEIKDIFCGPLISRMIISKPSLPVLLNATILNIYRKQNATPLLEAQEQRKIKIEKIVEKFANKEKTENFLSILNLAQLVSRKEEEPGSKSKGENSSTKAQNDSNKSEKIDRKLDFKGDLFEFTMSEEKVSTPQK